MISWIALYPELYRQEREQVEKGYSSLKLCDGALERGSLAYHGELVVRGSGGTKRYKILFQYPRTFPYHLPFVVPLQALPGEEPHLDWKVEPDLKSARHQMPGGVLCLIEQDPFRNPGEIVGGVNILRRAEKWFFSIENKTNPYDSIEADIQAHIPMAADILIGPEFYDSDLKVGGFFYGGRVWDGEDQRARFLGISISSDFSAPVGFRDSRKILQTPFPWIRNKVWNAAQALGSGESQFGELLKEEVVIRGVWWDLPEEPPPPRTGAHLLKIIRDQGLEGTIEKALDEIRSYIATEKYAYFGLRFPDRKDGYDWVFLILDLREKPQTDFVPVLSPAKKIEIIEAANVFGMCRHSLRPQTLALRNQGRVPETLAEKKIALLGTGALGSCIGDLLAKAGAGELHLFDKDIMEVGNSIRHIVGIDSFGVIKAGATGLKLIQHNPFCRVKIWNGDLLASFENLEIALSVGDLSISTTADESVETAVNEVATRLGKTVYYARAVRGGASGRIFRVIPGKDACGFCIRLHKQQGEELGTWLTIEEDGDTVLAHECGNPIIASSGADLTLIGSLAVRLVLDDMKNGYGEANHWLWTTEIVEGHPALQEPYKLSARNVPPYERCPFCSEPPVKKIRILASVKAMMGELARRAKGNEVCGIFVGYFKDDGTVEVVAASDVGPNAKGTPDGCWRDVEYVQKWIDGKLAQDANLRYVGEWHSHPSSDTRPSHTDVESLMGIAASENYLCPTPIMMVLGLSDQGEVSASAYSFAVERPYKEIEWEETEG